MNFKTFSAKLAFCLSMFLIIWGCSKSPLAPNRATVMNISIPMTNELRAALLGSNFNSLFYCVSGAGGVSLMEGTTGSFSAPASTGSINLSVTVPPGAQVLSLQLNSFGLQIVQAGPPVTVETPLAVGAIALDSINKGSTNENPVVEMGSVTRTCYWTNEANTTYAYGSRYGFATDALAQGTVAVGTGGPVTAYDIAFDCPLGPFYMQDGSGNSVNATSYVGPIAYLGTGRLVDYDSVPPDSNFYIYSTQAKAASGAPVSTLELNDVYCVKLNSMAGHAWVQITDPGTMGTTGPSFRFRVNSKLPYYAYDETLADSGNACNASW
jgi:hypothetical protein